MTPRLVGGPHSVLTFSRWNLSKQQTLQVIGLHSHPICPNLPIKTWTRLLCSVGSSERGGVFPGQEATLQTGDPAPLQWEFSGVHVLGTIHPTHYCRCKPLGLCVSAFLSEDRVGLGVSETSSRSGHSLRGTARWSPGLIQFVRSARPRKDATASVPADPAETA